jgi:hypothetical protein
MIQTQTYELSGICPGPRIAPDRPLLLLLARLLCQTAGAAHPGSPHPADAGAALPCARLIIATPRHTRKSSRVLRMHSCGAAAAP